MYIIKAINTHATLKTVIQHISSNGPKIKGQKGYYSVTYTKARH